MIAVAAAAVALIAGVVIVIKNDKGQIIAEIESDGPIKAKVADGLTVEVASSAARDMAQPPSAVRAAKPPTPNPQPPTPSS